MEITEVIKLLEWILNHSSGGGTWRRVIMMKIEELEDKIKESQPAS